MDAMHLMVHQIKAAWRQCKVAAVLFLDIEGTFPNAVTSLLIHNLRMHQIPEAYVQFIGQLLKEWWTRLKFDNFTLDWVNVDNGIVQDDPLSMILYLFYNAGILMDMGKGEMKIAYVDDANYFAEGSDFEEAYVKLSDMMTHAGGGQDWSKEHNSHFEMSKLTLVGFSRHRVPDPQCPRKTMPMIRPDLTMCGTTTKASTTHKFLGIIFDQEL